MKKVLTTLMVFALALTCLFAQGSAESAEKKQLVISTWGLSEDLLWQDVFTPFEEEYNCEIVLETGNDQERFTRLQNDPNSTVDIIELNFKTTATGVAEGLFATLSADDVESYDELIPAAQNVISAGYGVPFTLNSIGIIYDESLTGMKIESWEDLWDPALKGKIAVPDITTTFGPALIAMCSDVKGVDIASDNGETGFASLEELKPNVVKTYSRSSDIANLMSNGEVAAAIVGDFAYPVILKAVPTAQIVVPQSGTYANFNITNINKNSDNYDLALAFINYRIKASTQELTARDLNEAPVNGAAVLTPEVAENKTVGDVAARAKMVDFTVVNANLDAWVDRFNRLMNN